MRFCRYSTNDHQCDVFVYEAETHFVTLVARYRIDFAGNLPPPVAMTADNRDACIARRDMLFHLIETCEKVEITLPHSGKSFEHKKSAECADNLEALRSIGYRIPQSAIDKVRARPDIEEDSPETPLGAP